MAKQQENEAEVEAATGASAAAATRAEAGQAGESGTAGDTPAPRIDGEERLFHFSDGAASHKFWGVRVRGAEQTVRFGRIGTAGQERTKQFADAEAARAATERLVAEKREKGYRPVTAAEAAQAEPRPVNARRAGGRRGGGAGRHPVAPWRQLALPFADPEPDAAPEQRETSAAADAGTLLLTLDF